VPDDNELQESYGYWRSRSDGSDSLERYLCQLLSNRLGPPLPFLPRKIVGNQVFVAMASDTMFYLLLDLHMGDFGLLRGALITGLPGAGASP
jgi:hypothetical protein